MAVGAQNAAAIGIIEQDEIANQLVLIRGDSLAKNAEGWIAFALREIAQDLVVSAIFFDDVDDVRDRARFADAFGDGDRFLVGAWLLKGIGDGFAMKVGVNLLR